MFNIKFLNEHRKCHLGIVTSGTKGFSRELHICMLKEKGRSQLINLHLMFFVVVFREFEFFFANFCLLVKILFLENGKKNKSPYFYTLRKGKIKVHRCWRKFFCSCKRFLFATLLKLKDWGAPWPHPEIFGTLPTWKVWSIPRNFRNSSYHKNFGSSCL